jgi:translocation and assembly module TamA
VRRNTFDVLSSWFGSGRFLVLFATLAFGVIPLGAQTPHTARIEGVDDPALLALLHSVSSTLDVEAEVPASLLHLRRRAEGDVEAFMGVFQSRGYYGAKIDLDLDRDAALVSVVFRVSLGPQYVFGDLQILPDGDALADVLPPPDVLGLTVGAPALADVILAADSGLLEHLRAHGYPAPAIAKRDVVVVHDARTVDVAFHVQPGARAVYGAPDYAGLERTRPVVVDRLLPWKEGDPFDQRQLGELRTRLYETGLFATAAAEALPGEIDVNGAMPVRVTVTERPPRTISTGLEYKSDEGVGAHVDWEHRNMKGLGHDFGVNATLATELRELGLRYRVNRYRRLDQDLGLSFRIAQEEREAYDSERIDALALVDRTVNPRLNISMGAGIRVGNVEQRGEESSYELIYFPVEARLDRSDDLLDPSRGFKFRARIEPYIDPFGDLRLFTKGDVEFSYYLGFGAFETEEGRTLPNWVLASRVRVGGIAGEELEDIPADVRFYGGGGGSIRGYRYQTVSPLDDDDPIGGRSLAEFSIELRRRISESLGLVAFIDGGSAFESAWPDFGSDIQYGAGLGVRYYTPLGPMRFDVAVPLNKRDEIDDSFQIYLSIGHAF